MSLPALRLENIKYTHDQGLQPALEHINLSVAQGEWIAIVGTSGSGKSTLAEVLSGYLPRSGGGKREGVLLVDGIDPASATIQEVATRIGLVFQDPDAQLVQGIVEDEVAFGPENLCFPVNLIEDNIVKSLQAVDFAHKRYHRIKDLSGGQKQRTAIASMLSLEPPIMIFDEVTASLDSSGKAKILSMLQQLHLKGHTIITLSGRIDDIASAAPRLVVMSQGTIVRDGAFRDIADNNRAELIELGLLAGLPNVTDSEGQIGRETQSLLEIKDLSYAYHKNTPQVLQDVNLVLRQGEWVLLCGENGSGKTTLSRLLIGLIPAPKGHILWEGKDISRLNVYKLAGEIGYVFQQPEQQFVTSTVLDEVLYGQRIMLHLRPNDPVPEGVLNKAHRFIYLIGLEGLENESPYLLSGGKKKLLSVVSAFMVPKKLYILDEPTAGMDYQGAALLISLCREAVRQGSSLLIITHEQHLFQSEPTTTWNINNGHIYGVTI